jgi:hypothetical protein
MGLTGDEEAADPNRPPGLRQPLTAIDRERKLRRFVTERTEQS